MPGAGEFPEERLRTLEAAAGVVYWQGDMPGAQVLYDECLELVRATGEKRAIANALYNASFTRLVNRSDIPAGVRMLEEALPNFRAVNDELGVARSQWALASARHFEGRLDETIAALDEAIPLFRKLDERFSLGWALHTRTVVAVLKGECARAQEFVHEGLEIFAQAGDLTGMALLLDDAASVVQLCGDQIRALRLAGAADAHQATTGAGLGAIVGAEEGRRWKQEISTDEERRAWAQGQAMTLEQAVAYALEPESAAQASA
jgi:tetratricopeptide (TPR) repeat protein